MGEGRFLTGVLCVVAAWLAAASPGGAQILPIPPTPSDLFDDNLPAPMIKESVFDPRTGKSAEPATIWARFDYQLGWVRTAPMAIPLLNTGSAKNARPGAVGQSGTSNVQGDTGIGYGVMSGGRFLLGGWFDEDATFGIEGGGYLLAHGKNTIDNPSDQTGTPLMALPYFSVTPGSVGENAQLIANPKKQVGVFQEVSTLQPWGAELNSVFSMLRQPGLEFSLLAGARYDNIEERLGLLSTSTVLAKPGTQNTNFSLDDNFNTRNEFYGGQLGARLHLERDVWSLDLTSKIALGATHEVVEIHGQSVQFGPPNVANGVFPGGLFTQPSNIGRRTASQFTAVPTLGLRFGYQFAPRIRASFGYDFMYWNQVVRPGDQIDRDVNLTQSAILGKTHGVLSGPDLPAPLFVRSGFWEQAISAGVEFGF